MKARRDPLTLLSTTRPHSEAEARALSDACRLALSDYRKAVANGAASRRQTTRARRAFLHLGGDPVRSTASLKDYDHERFGPFLGVSDAGSAADEIRKAAFASPKARALSGARRPIPLEVGLAVDAERLGGVGETAVGPDEYADIWLASVDRLLITTNVGTRVNVRVYQREPHVEVEGRGARPIASAKARLADAFRPFTETPDGRPRPLTVFVRFPSNSRLARSHQRTVLRHLAAFVSSGEAARRKRAPAGHQLGLAVTVAAGPAGRDAAIDAIQLAASAGIRVVSLEGVRRPAAERVVSLAGLLDYFPGGLAGPIVRAAAAAHLRLRMASLPDTDTIGRTTWVGLATARTHGADLGKYGCFPLTLAETGHVVEQVQRWMPDWSAAPVFFVDQGLIGKNRVDVGRDIPRGLRSWLKVVARYGVRVVLIDTFDKASGTRLMRTSTRDGRGFLGPRQIADLDAYACALGIKVLWAGGLGARETFEMGRRGVFGIYVTSAAATTVPVGKSYARDPALAGLKEPSKAAVLRIKILLEAGFLSARLASATGQLIERQAEQLLTALDAKDAVRVKTLTAALAATCVVAWKEHWRSLRASGKLARSGS